MMIRRALAILCILLLPLSQAEAQQQVGGGTFGAVTISGSGQTSYTVGSGGNFTTLTAALTTINQQILTPNQTIVLNMLDGGTIEPAALSWFSAFTNQVYIQPQHVYTPTITSIQSSSGSAGAWSVVLNMSSVANITTSMDAIITAAAGGSNPTRLDGDFAITNVDAVNTRITVTDTNRSSAAPSGAVTANTRIAPRITLPASTDGFDIWNAQGVLNIDGVSIVGSGAGGFQGISSQDVARVFIQNVVGVRGFGEHGALSLYKSEINGGEIVASGNGANGLSAQEGGSISLINTIASGNGNNGASASLGGEIFLSNGGTASVLSGNATDGALALEGGLIDAGAAAANDNASFGYAAGTRGYINLSNGATESGNTSGALNIGLDVTSASGTAALLGFDGGGSGFVRALTSSGAIETELGQSSGIPRLMVCDSSGTTCAFLSHSGAGAMTLGTTNSGTDGTLQMSALVAGGATPTLTGTCTTGTKVGGQNAGSFLATCSAQTVIMTFATTAPNGWACVAQDQTTSTDTLKQTANGATSCTLTGTTAASDKIVFSATAY